MYLPNPRPGARGSRQTRAVADALRRGDEDAARRGIGSPNAGGSARSRIRPPTVHDCCRRIDSSDEARPSTRTLDQRSPDSELAVGAFARPYAADVRSLISFRISEVRSDLRWVENLMQSRRSQRKLLVFLMTLLTLRDSSSPRVPRRCR